MFGSGFIVSDLTMQAYSQVVTNGTVVVPEETVEQAIELNTGSLIAGIVAITGLIGTLGTLLPSIISIKRNYLGLKSEHDATVLAASQAMRETDQWVLSKQEDLKIALTASQNMSKDLVQIIENNRDKLDVGTAQINNIKVQLDKIGSVIPTDQEIKDTRQELLDNAGDPKKIG